MIFLVAGPILSAEPEHKYDGVYTGKRSLTKGMASASCFAENDDVSVTVTGETLTFTNSALKKYLMLFFLARTDRSAKRTRKRAVTLCIIMVV